ncbi:MAG: thioredoxin domain-containing protein [Candidatus Aenigmatarchaeota archaeon]
MNMKYVLGVITIIIVAILLYLWASTPVEPREYDEFAKCLTDSGAVMYGTEWCGHCQNQKAMFGNSFSYVNYVDCDNNKLLCDNAGVEGYPTWRIDANNYPGEKTLQALSDLSGCSL